MAIILRSTLLLALLLVACQRDAGKKETPVVTASSEIEAPRVSPSAVSRQAFTGTCDGSAGLAVGRWYVTANDEDNIIRVYDPEKTEPIANYNLNTYLGVSDENSETDIEGVAQLGDFVYWITSHGRNPKGKPRPNRYRFFATRLYTSPEEDLPMVESVGDPFRELTTALIQAESLASLKLEQSIGDLNEREDSLAPKKKGLNIEGLTVAPDKVTLWIGFRNPIPKEGALIVPLENPYDVVIQGAKPRLGTPIFLDLGGLGIRSMTRDPSGGYVISAGSYKGEDSPFELFQWSGRSGDAPRRLETFANFRPEAIFFNNDGRLVMLSDDGERWVETTPSECDEGYTEGRCECKEINDKASHLKSFEHRVR